RPQYRALLPLRLQVRSRDVCIAGRTRAAGRDALAADIDGLLHRRPPPPLGRSGVATALPGARPNRQITLWPARVCMHTSQAVGRSRWTDCGNLAETVARRVRIRTHVGAP